MRPTARGRTQIGPALTARDAAQLLGVTRQAVAKRGDLVALRSRSGRLVYPVVQFAGRAPLPGLGDVVRTLREVVEPLMIASWLTGADLGLEGRRPVDALAVGEDDRVLQAARRFAAGMGQ